MRPDRRLTELLGIVVPIIQAPMAGSNLAELAVAVSQAGGLGSLPCATLGPADLRRELAAFRQGTSKPVNVNFFAHRSPAADPARESAWRERLQPYAHELGLDPATSVSGAGRAPFDEAMADLVAELAPEVVSFHFGLPERALLERVRRTGARILSSATTVEEALYLEAEGCDAIVAQGCEAGGHRGMFLARDVATQVGTFALVPQVVDAVKVPVIAAGGVADGRGIVAALALGASGVQIGTAYLLCPEARTSAVHRAALKATRDDRTALTNVITGRPARGMVNRVMRELGPLSDAAPEFPLAAAALAPLRTRAEASGSGDFSPLWSGQAGALAREMPAGELTRRLWAEALERLAALRETTT